MIGKTISHYKILEKLGEGGMGVVYKAEDTRLERIVALKFLSTTAIVGDEEKKRFKREARAAAALNHPNIAHIYAIDEENGKLFIAMEFIEGKSLAEMVASPLPLDKAIDYATQTAAGLQAAHEKGIVHRDIKGDYEQAVIYSILNESGREEVYVVLSSGSGGKWQISNSGGTSPVWALSGRELFYLRDENMMAVAIDPEHEFSAAKPEILFQLPEGVDGASGYDVSGEDQRFMMHKTQTQSAGSGRINIVLNWFQELKLKVPTKE